MVNPTRSYPPLITLLPTPHDLLLPPPPHPPPPPCTLLQVKTRDSASANQAWTDQAPLSSLTALVQAAGFYPNAGEQAGERLHGVQG